MDYYGFTCYYVKWYANIHSSLCQVFPMFICYWNVMWYHHPEEFSTIKIHCITISFRILLTFYKDLIYGNPYSYDSGPQKSEIKALWWCSPSTMQAIDGNPPLLILASGRSRLGMWLWRLSASVFLLVIPFSSHKDS